MNIYVVGGCQEHGRNCFLIENDNEAVMLDCGVLKSGVITKYPKLTREQIKKTKYIFLSHSHEDHTGALPWLYENGFTGQVILSETTYHQMKYKPGNCFFINEQDCQKREMLSESLIFTWGRSGHCSGAVWYLITYEGNRIFYSGDYFECSPVYHCDLVRNIIADFAIIDCAYGDEPTYSKQVAAGFVKLVSGHLSVGKSVLLPCPVNGRGLDFIRLLITIPKVQIAAEEYLYNQYVQQSSFWNQNRTHVNLDQKLVIYDGHRIPGETVYIICDAQMKKQKNLEFTDKFIKAGDLCIFTGHLERDSVAQDLVLHNKALFYRYYVHQNKQDADNLIQANNFKNRILFHNE